MEGPTDGWMDQIKYRKDWHLKTVKNIKRLFFLLKKIDQLKI